MLVIHDIGKVGYQPKPKRSNIILNGDTVKLREYPKDKCTKLTEKLVNGRDWNSDTVKITCMMDYYIVIYPEMDNPQPSPIDRYDEIE